MLKWAYGASLYQIKNNTSWKQYVNNFSLYDETIKVFIVLHESTYKFYS